MKSSDKHDPRSQTQICTLLVIGGLLLAGAAHGRAGQTPKVAPRDSAPYGKTYGQWAVAYWQWALGIPAANNPLLDDTGASAGVGQSGPVWFLGGTFGNSVERTLTIPPGKGIFMPVHQWIFGSCAGDCEPSHPGVACDVPTLQAAAAAAATAVQTMDVSIDGKAVAQIRNYRAVSPGGFSVTLPEGNVLEGFGLPTPAGTYAPQVADGYWLMLMPLAAGKHTIQLHVVNPTYGSDYVIIYHITVTT